MDTSCFVLLTAVRCIGRGSRDPAFRSDAVTLPQLIERYLGRVGRLVDKDPARARSPRHADRRSHAGTERERPPGGVALEGGPVIANEVVLGFACLTCLPDPTGRRPARRGRGHPRRTRDAERGGRGRDRVDGKPVRRRPRRRRTLRWRRRPTGTVPTVPQARGALSHRRVGQNGVHVPVCSRRSVRDPRTRWGVAPSFSGSARARFTQATVSPNARAPATSHAFEDTNRI